MKADDGLDALEGAGFDEVPGATFAHLLGGLEEQSHPDATLPEAVLVGWDSLETPTYRHEALPAYQSGREFEDSIVAQLALLPGLCEAFGFQIG